MTLRDAARILGIPLDDIEVTLTFKVDPGPGDDPIAIERTRKLRIVRISREIRLKGALSEGDRAALMEEAACCPVSNTLQKGVRIEDIDVTDEPLDNPSR